MNALPFKLVVILLSLGSLAFGEVLKKEADDKSKTASKLDLPSLDPALADIESKLPPVEVIKGSKEVTEFRQRTRQLYNDQKFDELEALAGQLRTSKARFADGSWKLFHFYACQDLAKGAPEELWGVHEQKYKAWETAMPNSITARVAHAKFVVDYAWHARGNGWGYTVTPAGRQSFDTRLADALKILNDSASLKDKCPMWWSVRMNIGLGQGWKRAECEKAFKEAKNGEPEYWRYDLARAHYLLPRWYGQPGDWETEAKAEAMRPGSLGMEGYARVVIYMTPYYSNIFKETKVSWADTREGLEILYRKYPTSVEILSNYCKLACLYRERALARQLFDEIGGQMEIGIWRNKENFIGCRDWAYSK